MSCLGHVMHVGRAHGQNFTVLTVPIIAFGRAERAQHWRPMDPNRRLGMDVGRDNPHPYLGLTSGACHLRPGPHRPSTTLTHCPAYARITGEEPLLPLIQHFPHAWKRGIDCTLACHPARALDLPLSRPRRGRSPCPGVQEPLPPWGPAVEGTGSEREHGSLHRGHKGACEGTRIPTPHAPLHVRPRRCRRMDAAGRCSSHRMPLSIHVQARDRRRGG